MTAPVLFLHGMARSHRSLSKLRREVEAAGYKTWARTYPSRHMTIDELTHTVSRWIQADLGEGPFMGVTHSMGGILARHLCPLLEWERLVMLAPPNSGSRVAAALKPSVFYQWFFGPAGQELAEPDAWPEPPGAVGIIAGTKGPSIGNPPSWVTAGLSLLPAGEPHDGTVTVAETKHPRMTDFATVPASHTWIMNHPRTVELVLEFLREGRFPVGSASSQ